jgi:hypothetical protein
MHLLLGPSRSHFGSRLESTGRFLAMAILSSGIVVGRMKVYIMDVKWDRGAAAARRGDALQL